MAWPISFGCHCHVNFTLHSGIVIVPMDLTSGRRGVGPCSRVVMEAFVAGQEPDKDCGSETVAVSKLPYYLQRPFYQAKEAEPTQPIADASAQSGESAESPAPNVEEGPKSTTTAPRRSGVSTIQSLVSLLHTVTIASHFVSGVDSHDNRSAGSGDVR
jgi:hypothetical protein